MYIQPKKNSSEDNKYCKHRMWCLKGKEGITSCSSVALNVSGQIFICKKYFFSICVIRKCTNFKLDSLLIYSFSVLSSEIQDFPKLPLAFLSPWNDSVPFLMLGKLNEKSFSTWKYFSEVYTVTFALSIVELSLYEYT